jgi:hypothetical protein
MLPSGQTVDKVPLTSCGSLFGSSTSEARRHVQTSKTEERFFCKQSICSMLATAMEAEACTTRVNKQQQKHYQHKLQMHPQQC